MHQNALIFSLAKGDESSIGASGKTPGGLRYSYIIENLSKAGNGPTTGIYAVKLPFKTDIHLFGLPKSAGVIKELVLPLETLDPVTLEGDYSSYFSLYAGRNQQAESRYVLDPEAMSYSIDFCAHYTWEIFNNTLYFGNQGELPDLHIIDAFVEQITPVNAVSAALRLNQKPQTKEKFGPKPSKFTCPICATALYRGTRWYGCPAGHGYCITSRDIILTRTHMNSYQRIIRNEVGARPDVLYDVVTVAHKALLCPNDKTEMVAMEYQTTGALTYDCPTCDYRWIDGKDLDTILGEYRNDGEDPLLHGSSLYGDRLN